MIQKVWLVAWVAVGAMNLLGSNWGAAFNAFCCCLFIFGGIVLSRRLDKIAAIALKLTVIDCLPDDQEELLEEILVLSRGGAVTVKIEKSTDEVSE